MKDVTEYCDLSYKRLVGLKAGLYDIITKTEAVQDSAHSEAVGTLKALVLNIEAGIDELKTQCPEDWSQNKKDLDDIMEDLAETLKRMADRADISMPDTTAWI